MSAQEICRKLEQISKRQYEVYMQNGKEAGQTVNHAHLHLVPIDREKHLEALEPKEDRVKSEEEMAREAAQYRSCFEQSRE